MKKWVLIFYIFLSITSGLPCVFANDDSIQLLTFKTHSRLSLKVDPSVPVEWKNTGKGFEILLKGIELSDLGASQSAGEEQKWKSRFENLNDLRVGSVALEQISGGVKISGKWKFPGGELELAHPSMNVFDFREQNVSRFNFDFWLKDGPTLASEKAKESDQKQTAAVRENQEKSSKSSNRSLASEKTSTSTVIENICDRPLSEAQDVFLEFAPAHQKVEFSRWFPGNVADTDFPYYKPKKKTKESQYVHLALKLYTQGKLALVIRTLDFFDTEFPKSDFRYEMRFLRANSLIKLGFQAKGEEILKQLMKDAKDSPVALHSAMYLTPSLVAKNLPLSALENFFWLIRYHPHHSLNWVFHLGAAECLYALRQTERAMREYQWVIDNAPLVENKAEAAFRLGDLFQSRYQYAQALAAYSQGFNYFGSFLKDIPSASLNRAEALYQVGQTDRAQQEFEKYLANHANHPESWRATFRLGELFGKASFSKENQEKSRKWFYETINSYPFSAGATLARARLAPCADHAGFNLSAAERFFAIDAKEFSSPALNPRRYDEFRSLAHVRTLMSLGSSEKALEVSLQELRLIQSAPIRKLLSQTSHWLFRKVILDLIEAGKKYEALSFYDSKSKSIPETDQKKDYDYLLKLAVAASDLSLTQFSHKLSDAYKKASQLREFEPENSSTGTPAEVENTGRKEDSTLLAERSFIAAKSLLNSASQSLTESQEAEVLDHLAKIHEDSEYLYGKEIILGLLESKKAKWKSAITHVSRANLLNHSLRLDAWIASLQENAEDFKSALELYSELEKDLSRSKVESPSSTQESYVESALGVPVLPSLDEVFLIQGKLHEKRGKWGEAAVTYSRAVHQGKGGDRLRFEFARTLLKSSQRSKRAQAQEVLQELAKKQTQDEKDNHWKKLAVETLASEKSLLKLTDHAKEGNE